MATPDASRPAASGSAKTIFRSGIDALRALPAPWKVPPVPYPVTQCVNFLPDALKSAMISGPVVASWNFQFASFSNLWEKNQPPHAIDAT